MSEKKVSVIVPVYNKESCLSDCLSSMLRQTWKETEIIAVNDGSTDGSRGIIDGFAEQDSRVIPLHIPHGGVSSARNAGIRAASGEFLAFVDADDRIEPDYIQNMVLAIGDADLCISGYKAWNPQQNSWPISAAIRLLSLRRSILKNI